MTQTIDKHFFRKLLFLAAPVSLQFLLYSSRYIADVLMIGQLGDAPLAAAGMATSIHLLANSVVFGVSGGIGLLCAQYFGAKRYQEISKTVVMGLLVGAAVMTPLVILFALWPQWVFMLATSQPAVAAEGARYLQITSTLPLLIGVVAGVGAGLNAIGRPHLNLVFTAVAVAANIGFNWIFIFGHLGAPAMGLSGAALGTLLSLILELVVIVSYLFLGTHVISITREVLRAAMTRATLAHFVKITAPLMVGGVAWHVGNFIYQTVYGHMGAMELAAVTMVHPMRTLCFAFFWGISSATGVMLGHLLGAGQFDAARVQSRVLILLGLGVSLLAAGLIYLFQDPIFALFGNLEPGTLVMGKQVLLVMLATIWILAINVVGIVGVLQSGADNRFILKMDIFCQWAVGIPLCYSAAFIFHLPLHLVFLCAFGEEIVKLAIWIPRVLGGAWIRNLTESAPQKAAA